MRLRGVSEDSEDLSGLIPSLEEKFNKFGLTLKKNDSTFKSTYEILKDVSSIWSDISDMDRADLLEDISGKRNAQTVAAIIQNMQTAIDVSDSFAEAQGSAILEHQRYMEGIEYAYNRMQGSMTELHNSLLKSQTLIKGLNVANAMIENVSALGKFSVMIAGLTLALGFFSIANRKAIKEMTDLQIVSSVGGLKKFASDVILAGKMLLGFDTGLQKATISATALNVATTALLLGLPLLAQGIGMVINHQKRLAEEMNENIEAFRQQSQIKDSLDGLIDSYKELGGQSNLTAEEQDKLLKVKEKIKELLPESTKYIDNENLSLEEQLEILEKLNEEELIRAKKKAQDTISRYGKNYETDLKILKEYERQVEVIQSRIDELYAKKYGNGKILTKDEEKELKSLNDQLEIAIGFRDRFAERTKAVETAEELLKTATLGTSDALKKQNDGIENFNENTITHEQMVESLIKKYEDVTSKLQTYNVFLSELNSKNGLSAKSMQEIITKYQELLPYLDDEKLLRQQLISIIAEEEKTQKQAYVNMLMYSEDFFNAKVKGNKELVEQLEKYYNVDLENAKSLAHAKELIESELIKNLSGKWAEYYNVLTTNHSQLLEDNLVRAAMAGNTDAAKVLEAANEFKKMENRFNDIVLGGSNINFSDINLSGVKDSKNKKDKKKKEEYKAEADRYAKINLELEKSNTLLARNKTLQDLAGDDLAKKIDLMEQQIALEKEQQQLLHEKANIARQERVELERSLSKQGFKFAGEGDNREIINLDKIKGKTKEVEEQFKRYNDIQSKEIPSLQQMWTGLSKSIKDVSLNKLVAEFELADQKTTKLQKSLSLLEYEFKLLSKSDVDGKTNNIVKQIENLEQQLISAESELKSLGEVGEQSPRVIRDRFEELTKRIQDTTLAIKSQEQSLIDMREALKAEHIKKLNDAYSQQQDQLSKLESIQERLVAIIRKRGEEEKKALDESHKAEMDSLEERHNERKKKYQEDLDLLKKSIQDKIDALDEQYEQEDYLEQLNKEREQANELQRQIDVLSLDDSLTARNKTIELRKQLADQNEKIAKMQQKKERDLLKKSLQDQLKDKEKDAKDKEDIANKTYENEKKRLEEDYKINKEYLDKKYADDRVYAEAKEAILRGQVEVTEGVFMDIYDAFVDFENKFGKGMGILGNLIRDEFHENLREAQRLLRETANLSQGLLGRPNSDRDYSDDEIGWRDPRPERPDRPSRPDRDEQVKQDRPPEFMDWSRGDYDEYIENGRAWENAKDEYEKARLRNKNAILRSKYWGTDRMWENKYNWRELINWRGFADGGKNTVTGLHMLHGTKTDPEWIFNDKQLKATIANITTSTLKAITPKIPNIVPQQGVVLQIDSLLTVEGNVTKDALPQLKTNMNNALDQLKNVLNKNGTRPSFK